MLAEIDDIDCSRNCFGAQSAQHQVICKPGLRHAAICICVCQPAAIEWAMISSQGDFRSQGASFTDRAGIERNHGAFAVKHLACNLESLVTRLINYDDYIATRRRGKLLAGLKHRPKTLREQFFFIARGYQDTHMP
jgi:hypothetical protein